MYRVYWPCLHWCAFSMIWSLKGKLVLDSYRLLNFCQATSAESFVTNLFCILAGLETAAWLKVIILTYAVLPIFFKYQTVVWFRVGQYLFPIVRGINKWIKNKYHKIATVRLPWFAQQASIWMIRSTQNALRVQLNQPNLKPNLTRE